MHKLIPVLVQRSARLSRAVLIALFASIALIPEVVGAQDGTGAMTHRTLRVGVAGSAPFVVNVATQEGASLEVWQKMAAKLGLRYDLVAFPDVPRALQMLEDGAVDVVVGPVTITSDRARHVRFTQPYFRSSLSIMSRSESPTLRERLLPFFSGRFFVALGVFLLTLGAVGTLLWLTERKRNPEQFPEAPARGIANGMWCAIVTMSTTGYGDRAPITFWGRMITATWIIISLIGATAMIAGIASTFTLTGMQSVVISTASELRGKDVGVVRGSPAETFARRRGANSVEIGSLEQGYDLLKARRIDALVYDRPQLLYLLQQHPDEHVAVSTAEYEPQYYGFALPLNTSTLHRMNVALLSIMESGGVARILNSWLGSGNE